MICSVRLHKQQLASSRESWIVFLDTLPAAPRFLALLALNLALIALNLTLQDLVLRETKQTSLLEWLSKLKCVRGVEEREENCQVISEKLFLWLRTSFACVFSCLQPTDGALLLLSIQET